MRGRRRGGGEGRGREVLEGMYTPHTRTHRMRLELEAEELTQAGDTESERLMDVYERLDELDASTAEVKAARILHGLGQFREGWMDGWRNGGREGGRDR